MRTQVAIIGAGPAGLLLGQLLHKQGVDNIILERHTGEHVLGRIRAGVIEQVAVDLLDEAGVGARMHRDGLVHDGTQLCVEGARHRVDFKALTGRTVTVYGQTEITKDLMDGRAAAGAPTVYAAYDVALHDVFGAKPRVTYRADGKLQELECDFIAGCDGFHGISHKSVPPGAIRRAAGLDHYSSRALARVWKAERFSWWMTMLLHTFPDSGFDQKMQLAELDYLFRSRAAATAFAENYVGLPF